MILGRLWEAGLSRLIPDLLVLEEMNEGVLKGLDESEGMELTKVILDNSDIFDALCRNIGVQIGQEVKDGSGGLAIALRAEVRRQNVEEGVLWLVQKCVQVAHLDAMRQCLGNGDEDGVVLHVRFLRLECGVEVAEYRMVLQDLLKRVYQGRMLMETNHEL